jgi:hypothetical protein
MAVCSASGGAPLYFCRAPEAVARSASAATVRRIDDVSSDAKKNSLNFEASARVDPLL